MMRLYEYVGLVMLGGVKHMKFYVTEWDGVNVWDCGISLVDAEMGMIVVTSEEAIDN